MNKYRLIENYKIRTNDAVFNKYVSPVTIQSIIEDMATVHATKLGFGREDSLKNGVFWILRSSKFSFKRLPKIYEEVEVHTWPSGIDRMKALRRLAFYVKGELIGEVISYWLMVDLKTKKPSRANFFFDEFDNYQFQEKDFFKLPKVKLPSEMTLSYKKQVMPRDIDWNGHLNNVRYIDILYNAIPIDVLKDNLIMELQIDYLRECKINDIVDVYYSKENEYIYLKGENKEKTSFTAKIRLQENIEKL